MSVKWRKWVMDECQPGNNSKWILFVMAAAVDAQDGAVGPGPSRRRRGRLEKLLLSARKHHPGSLLER